MERNLALELVRVTEAAALASARWMGKGDSEAASRAANEAVTVVMGSVKMIGHIVIGDTHLASPPAGKRAAGGGDVPEVDVAIDALQSIESVALGRPYAISTIAVSNPDSFLKPPVPYMNKIAVGPDAAGSVDIRKSPLDNLVNIAAAKRCYVEDLTVCILARDRHRALIEDVRSAGARILLVSDGDLTAMLATVVPASGVDVVMGIGGSAEGVLAAAALQCVGGDLQAQFHPRDDAEGEKMREAGFASRDRVLRTVDLVRGANTMFAATGVTNSDVLPGVQFVPGGAITHSLVMRSASGTVRHIKAHHRFDRKPVYR
ncbi:MAG: class II fructose-bisphosphatase [Candidatus Krumholzibacteria bacterium]|nr:class II fructose-bisphosphatase [Candidatus Krumholzibacteria bacterium]MDH4337933.1 class II fructose-bisphosphatase [Candidatus Krumholzibacteria bacterium]MDH5270321.1 class II fructose-bisphosphatase [Candidatus Krumholzibacteria bacterium]